MVNLTVAQIFRKLFILYLSPIGDTQTSKHLSRFQRFVNSVIPRSYIKKISELVCGKSYRCKDIWNQKFNMLIFEHFFCSTILATVKLSRPLTFNPISRFQSIFYTENPRS